MFQNIHITDIFFASTCMLCLCLPFQSQRSVYISDTVNMCAQKVHIDFKEHSIKAAQEC